MAGDNEAKMEKTVNSLKEEYNTIRTGRASASIFDKVRVDYYGTPTPLSQVGTISIPEARLVVVSPFDKSLISAIERQFRQQTWVLTQATTVKLSALQFLR